MPTLNEKVTFYAKDVISEYFAELESKGGSGSRSALVNEILMQWVLLDKLGLLKEVLEKAALTQGCLSVEQLRDKLDEIAQRLSNKVPR